MALRQQIIPSRRAYNRWVADQTLEDYALRFTATSARKWRPGQVANTALGATSFLALEAIGGTVTLRYGFLNAAAAILASGVLIFLTALPIAIGAARRGLDIDLLTRGAGFGYLGSTVTSLVYASFTFIFFAIEASILAGALRLCLGVPEVIGYIAAALVVIPIVLRGMRLIGRFQRWTQPAWIVLNIAPFALLAFASVDYPGWTQFTAAGVPAFALLPFGAAASVIMSLVAQVGEQVDFLRFLAKPKPGEAWRWWLAVIAAGPGWIGPGMLKLFAGSLLAWLALAHGMPPERAVQPGIMYATAFGSVLPRGAALALTGALVVLAQLKINVTNAYAGSIAWSNFFSRLTRSHPGRVVWVVFNVAIALLLMEIGFYQAVEAVLALYSVVASAWVGALVADLVVIRSLGLAPPAIEFKRAHLYDVNPVGTGAMALAIGLGGAAYAGALGELAQCAAPVIALAAAFAAAPAIAALTSGRFYLARRPRRSWAANAGARACTVCCNEFEPEDTAFCPVYGGAICSLCCSLDARCRDACKPHGRIAAQVSALLRHALPATLLPKFPPPLLRFLASFAMLATAVGAILFAIGLQTAVGSPADRTLLDDALWRAFFVLLIIAGVAAWLLVLAQQTQAAAEDETRRQTVRLMREIGAHRRTDAKLQKAKEVAEAANVAKSRFVVGVSHELRTPLNVVLGYAQLLELDRALTPDQAVAIRTVRRSGEHMAGLIEGLLDIAKIEAGRVQLDRRDVRLDDFLRQIADMFRLQAQEKGLALSYEAAPNLPAAVSTDETRLRQIVINLLSNAVKFTARGDVALRARRSGQLIELEVADTGIGIAPEDQQRIFNPFERVEPHGEPAALGIGLGLTITKLLTEILGGEITLRSRPGAGSAFTVRLLLKAVPQAAKPQPPPQRIVGFAGPPRTLMVVDDDAGHRLLLEKALSPLGFALLTAPDAAGCLRLAERCRPDAFLLDLSLPGMNGWQLARALRTLGLSTPIVILSASADDPAATFDERPLHDAFLAKPLDLHALVLTLGRLLRLTWVEALPSHSRHPAGPATPLQPHLAELGRLAEIGHVGALRTLLDQLAAEPGASSVVAPMRAALEGFRMDELATMIASAGQEAA